MSDKLNIHQAMLKFHAEFNGVDKTGFNPHFKSQHFTLEDIIHTTTPILNRLGLYVAHQVDGSSLLTSIYNSEGESLRSNMPMTLSNSPQAIGSMLTYYRRYNLCSLLNIAEKDDDGEAAMVEADLAEQRAKKTKPVPKPPPTDAQKSTLLDYVESGDLNAREVKYIETHIDAMTIEDADDLLVRIEGDKK